MCVRRVVCFASFCFSFSNALHYAFPDDATDLIDRCMCVLRRACGECKCQCLIESLRRRMNIFDCITLNMFRYTSFYFISVKVSITLTDRVNEDLSRIINVRPTYYFSLLFKTYNLVCRDFLFSYQRWIIGVIRLSVHCIFLTSPPIIDVIIFISSDENQAEIWW